ncbi:helix-turn-helix transcriptional regulator [Mycetocola spongiae]|uniref:helix-turn-helix transcriptional regulator n=1 Tax=Mycetocola spongiae TaxID=2859226 RepID=UPI001CF150F4|nr:WYL domain-containing protein [Mycetocola spongiae]UCR89483.1 WYL domain-containing protein [Mycetocola spongiae]
MTATTRLLRLLSLLHARRDWPGAVLAERLEISPRTVRRDIERLRDMGYHILSTMGPDGGYRLAAGNELPPLLFDDEQVLALAFALRSAEITAPGLGEAAARALDTVRQVMPPRLRYRLDAAEFLTLARGPGEAPVPEVDPGLLLELSAAVRAREVLRCDYAGGTPRAAGEGPREVEPRNLVSHRGRWYLLAWDRERAQWRVLRADRITPRTPRGPRFEPRELPGNDVAEFMAGHFRGSAAGGDWPCRGTAILELPAEAVLPFAGDGTVEPLGPRRCSLTLGSWSWVGLAAAYNRFDTRIEVVHPAELSAAFGVLATRNALTARTGPRG